MVAIADAFLIIYTLPSRIISDVNADSLQSFDKSETEHFWFCLHLQKVGGPQQTEFVQSKQACQVCYLKLITGLTRLNRIDPPQLPCGHEYCKTCVEELRQKGVDKSCPLCRKPLPPGPEQLFDLGYGMFAKIKGLIDRSRPGVDEMTPWPPLTILDTVQSSYKWFAVLSCCRLH